MQGNHFKIMRVSQDWIDVICWVLPESNTDGLFKDLQEKDAIMAKLLSLERDWRSYIPSTDIVELLNHVGRCLEKFFQSLGLDSNCICVLI